MLGEGTWSGGGSGTLGGAWHVELVFVEALGPRDGPEFADTGCLRGLLQLLGVGGAILVHGAHGAAGWCGVRLLAPSVDGLPFICFASPPAGVSRSRIWHHETRLLPLCARRVFSIFCLFIPLSLSPRTLASANLLGTATGRPPELCNLWLLYTNANSFQRRWNSRAEQRDASSSSLLLGCKILLFPCLGLNTD